MSKNIDWIVSIKDQLGRTVRLVEYPKRIVSLVPSITETLYALGLEDYVVGRTKFCIHPKEYVSQARRVGGTKNVDVERVKALTPDLILANKEENTIEVIKALEVVAPIYISDVKTVRDALELISGLGILTNKTQESDSIISTINLFNSTVQITTPIKALYLIWQEPYMTIGSDTFIHSMMEKAGLANVYGDCSRYPEVELETRLSQTDVILLSSEPYPFKQKHADELVKKYNKPVMLVDGELFSWYGSRMLKAFPYFEKIKKDFLV